MKAFKVEFECSNCGHRWEEEFEAGYNVLQGTFSVQVFKGDIGAVHVRDIKCPVCKLERPVRVVSRQPLKDEKKTVYVTYKFKCKVCEDRTCCFTTTGVELEDVQLKHCPLGRSDCDWSITGLRRDTGREEVGSNV